MHKEFTQERGTQLRTQKRLSARDMSLSLGQNATYINKIENRESLPSLQGLFIYANIWALRLKSFLTKMLTIPLS